MGKKNWRNIGEFSVQQPQNIRTQSTSGHDSPRSSREPMESNSRTQDIILKTKQHASKSSDFWNHSNASGILGCRWMSHYSYSVCHAKCHRELRIPSPAFLAWGGVQTTCDSLTAEQCEAWSSDGNDTLKPQRAWCCSCGSPATGCLARTQSIHSHCFFIVSQCFAKIWDANRFSRFPVIVNQRNESGKSCVYGYSSPQEHAPLLERIGNVGPRSSRNVENCRPVMTCWHVVVQCFSYWACEYSHWVIEDDWRIMLVYPQRIMYWTTLRVATSLRASNISWVEQRSPDNKIKILGSRCDMLRWVHTMISQAFPNAQLVQLATKWDATPVGHLEFVCKPMQACLRDAKQHEDIKMCSQIKSCRLSSLNPLCLLYLFYLRLNGVRKSMPVPRPAPGQGALGLGLSQAARSPSGIMIPWHDCNCFVLFLKAPQQSSGFILNMSFCRWICIEGSLDTELPMLPKPSKASFSRHARYTKAASPLVASERSDDAVLEHLKILPSGEGCHVDVS